MELKNYHILIVDDDTKILKLLKNFFLQNNFLVSTALSVAEATELLNYFSFDLIILDVMLPQVTGIEFARIIKEKQSDMPIVMLTALSEPEDRIKGLEAGANDYLSKPFEPRELLLRVHNLIKSHLNFKKLENLKYFGNNYYNVTTRELFRNNKIIKLSTTEQKLLEILIQNPNVIISRTQLLQQLGNINERSIDVQIVRLRIKIEDNPKQPRYLKTIRNEGYALFL